MGAKSVQLSNPPGEANCLENYQSEISCHGQGPQTHLTKMLIMKFQRNICDVMQCTSHTSQVTELTVLVIIF